MKLRCRRWSPGRGFIKCADHGSTAVWLKPLHDGAQIAVYMQNWWSSDPYPTTWVHLILEVPRGSWMPWEVLDKVYRILWADRYSGEDAPAHCLFGGTWILREERGPSHKIYRAAGKCRKARHRPSHSMLRRFRPEERYATQRGRLGAEVPASVRKAVAPGYKERLAIEAYRLDCLRRWGEATGGATAIDAGAAVSLVH